MVTEQYTRINYQCLYHLGVVICDDYEDLWTIPNWIYQLRSITGITTNLFLFLDWDTFRWHPFVWWLWGGMPSGQEAGNKSLRCPSSFQWAHGIVYSLSWEEAGARDINHFALLADMIHPHPTAPAQRVCVEIAEVNRAARVHEAHCNALCLLYERLKSRMAQLHSWFFW